jgi:uncharacterized membrane protein YgdD (TMEM256/DUF423 family)
MFIKIAAWFLAAAVSAGAFGAHALKARFGEYEIGVWNTATLYLFIHALALLIVSIAERGAVLPADVIRYPQLCFVFGSIIFSGSLYLLALTGMKFLGAITPLGGALMILGWVLFALKL